MNSYLKSSVVYALVVILYTQANGQILEEDNGNANYICDNAVKYLFQEPDILDEIEPLNVPDIKHGKLETTNGKLHGLSSVERSGSCTYSVSDVDPQGNRRATVHGIADVATKNISFTMDYSVKVLFVWISGSMDGKLGHLSASAGAHLSHKGEPELDFIKVKAFDGIEITRMSAVIPQSSYILKAIANMIVQEKKDQIIKALEDGVSDFLGNRMKEISVN